MSQVLDLSLAARRVARGRPGTELDLYFHCLGLGDVTAPPGLVVRPCLGRRAELAGEVSRGLARVYRRATDAVRGVTWRLRLAPPGGVAAPPGRTDLAVGPHPSHLRRATDAVLALCATVSDAASGPLLVQLLPVGDHHTVLCLTRDPVTGNPGAAGEYSTLDPAVMRMRGGRSLEELAAAEPSLARRIRGLCRDAERALAEMLELEIQATPLGLYLLGARRADPGPSAALRLARHMARSGAWSRERAVERLSARHLDALLRPRPRRGECERLPVLARGKGISGGIVSGRAVFSVAAAGRERYSGRRSVLLAATLLPEELGEGEGPDATVLLGGGLCTAAAGWARRAAVPMVADLRDMLIRRDQVWVGDEYCTEGTWLTVDGDRGIVYVGEPRLGRSSPGGAVRELLRWADEARTRKGLEIRVNADTAQEVRRGLRLGATGVGLCRTERMLSGRRGELLRRFAGERRGRAGAADRKALVAAYRSCFAGMLRAARGTPLGIRLLDPSLDETGPLASGGGRLTGCRVGIVRPEIYDVQLEALFQAACRHHRAGGAARVEVIFPQVNTVGEIAALRERVVAVRRDVARRVGVAPLCRVGAMVETPRGALVAAELARGSEFLCFGTNDLTQYTLGLDRQGPRPRGPLEDDPFRHLDREAVLPLLRIATRTAREARPVAPVGICGEHAADPASLELLLRDAQTRPDYVSCAPSRLCLVRLVSAQCLIR